MRFTLEQLQKFADWEPVVAGYDRNVARDDMFIWKHVRPLIDEITKSGRFESHIFEDGGLSNYFACCFGRVRFYGADRDAKNVQLPNVHNVTLYLSLLAPVGVFARIAQPFGLPCTALSHIEPQHVCDPDEAIGELEELLVSMLRQTPYTLLTRDEINEPLPPEINPFEYCLCAEPWNKLFHVMFSNTD